MNLEKRLRALESGGGISEPVILHFADGSSRRIPGGGYMVDLLTAISRENVPAQQRQHLDWIRECVSATELGGGRMIEMLKCVLHGPAMPRDHQLALPGSALIAGDCR